VAETASLRPAAAAGAVAGVKPAPLDDVMLAMDVVDTLRHGDLVVARELSEEDRALQLKGKLRSIYKAQGIEVPDRILEDGVKALAESRFTYTPEPPSFRRTLALAWVRRATWGVPALIGLGLLVLVSGGWWFGIHLPGQRAEAAARVELATGIPAGLTAELGRVEALTRDPAILAEAGRIRAAGEAAARAGSLPDARAKLAELRAMTASLDQSFQVRVVSRPGVQSGFWREPRDNPRVHNYYLVVEAVDPQGRPVPVRITNEEDGATRETASWGQRVPAATFERIRADKADDGIIQAATLGEKPRGTTAITWRLPVSAGAVFDW